MMKQRDAKSTSHVKLSCLETTTKRWVSPNQKPCKKYDIAPYPNFTIFLIKYQIWAKLTRKKQNHPTLRNKGPTCIEMVANYNAYLRLFGKTEGEHSAALLLKSAYFQKESQQAISETFHFHHDFVLHKTRGFEEPKKASFHSSIRGTYNYEFIKRGDLRHNMIIS